jgi:hypothetical protein
MCPDARILLKSPSSQYFSDITIWSSAFITPTTRVITSSTIEKKYCIVEYDEKEGENRDILKSKIYSV